MQGICFLLICNLLLASMYNFAVFIKTCKKQADIEEEKSGRILMGKKIWASLDCFIEKGAVMGRKVANQDFLQALFAADEFDEYHFFPESSGHFNSLYSWTKEFSPHAASKLYSFSRLDLPKKLREEDYHCFHLSDCINYPAYLARLRNKYSRQIFPITSLTHSLSYQDYPASFLRHLWPGTTPRDCVVCSSSCGKEVLSRYYEYLRTSYSLPGNFYSPRLEHIPLGVDWEKYASVNPKLRAKARNSLDLGEKSVCVTALGRIAHYSKMDMVPFIRALQICLTHSPGLEDIVLVLAGGTEEGQEVRHSLLNLAANAGINLRIFPDPSEGEKLEILAASDIFVSPADNYQETFGLTLLEAGAAKLPVVAADFNGYRDLVEHGNTGMLVRTLGPEESGLVNDLAPLLPDSQSHLLLAQNICLDMQDMVSCLETLLHNEGLRREMGEKGRRASRDYDWARIIERYTALWDFLWEKDVLEKESLRGKKHPLGLDYAWIFSNYPKERLDSKRTVVWSALGRTLYRQQDFPVVYAGLEDLVPAEKLRVLLFLARGEIMVEDLCTRLVSATDISEEKASYFITWAFKQGYLCLAPEQG